MHSSSGAAHCFQANSLSLPSFSLSVIFLPQKYFPSSSAHSLVLPFLRAFSFSFSALNFQRLSRRRECQLSVGLKQRHFNECIDCMANYSESFASSGVTQWLDSNPLWKQAFSEYLLVGIDLRWQFPRNGPVQSLVFTHESCNESQLLEAPSAQARLRLSRKDSEEDEETIFSRKTFLIIAPSHLSWRGGWRHISLDRPWFWVFEDHCRRRFRALFGIKCDPGNELACIEMNKRRTGNCFKPAGFASKKCNEFQFYRRSAGSYFVVSNRPEKHTQDSRLPFFVSFLRFWKFYTLFEEQPSKNLSYHAK